MRLLFPLVTAALIGIAVLVAFLVGLGDDGGGGGGDLTAYFTKVEAALTEENTAFSNLTPPDLNEDDVIDEQERQGVVDFSTAQVQVLQDFQTAIKAIEPPSEVAAKHKETEDALAAEIALWQSALPRLETVSTLTDLDALSSDVFGSTEATAVFERISAACTALQTHADGNAITVDLQCDQQ